GLLLRVSEVEAGTVDMVVPGQIPIHRTAARLVESLMGARLLQARLEVKVAMELERHLITWEGLEAVLCV
ncbi:MAG: hypothetical protein ACK4UN_22130, partial [Limisphaerales bacterium]